MRLKIHHPKLLVAVLLVIMTATTLTAVVAQGIGSKDSVPGAFPSIPINAQLTSEEEEDAVNIVKTSGVVKYINGGQSWEASRIARTKIDGTEAIELTATWETPAESDGPWPVVRCQGTRKVVTTNTVSNITRLTVFIDMEAREVAAYSLPGPDSPDLVAQMPTFPAIGGDTTVKMYDFETGELVYDGTLEDIEDKLCPSGSEDD